MRRKNKYDKHFPIFFFGLLIVAMLLATVQLAKGGGPPAQPYKWQTINSGVAKDSTDVTTTLRAALAKAKTESGVLVLDSGVYLCSDSVIVRNVKLQLNPGVTVLFALTGAKKAFILGNGGHIEGGTIQVDTVGSVTGVGGFGSAICVGDYGSGTGAHDWSIKNVTIKTQRLNSVGINFFGDSYNWEISGVYVPNTATMGAFIEGHWGGADNPASGTYHPHDGIIENCKIDSMTYDGSPTYGIYLAGCYGIKVSHIDILHAEIGYTAYAGDYGFRHAVGVDTSLIEGNGMYAGYITGQSMIGRAIIVDGRAPLIDTLGSGTVDTTWKMPVTIEKCYFKGSDSTYGAILSFCDGVTLRSCTFENFSEGVGTGPLVKNATVDNCVISHMQLNGIELSYVGYGPSDFHIENCRIFDLDLSATGAQSGIYIGNAARPVIENNRIGVGPSDALAYGIHVASANASNITLQDNFVLDAATAAYQFTVPDECDVYTNNRAAAGLTLEGGTVGEVATRIGNFNYPKTDSTAGLYVVTDGSGNLSFASGAAGASASDVGDTANAVRSDAGDTALAHANAVRSEIRDTIVTGFTMAADINMGSKVGSQYSINAGDVITANHIVSDGAAYVNYSNDDANSILYFHGPSAANDRELIFNNTSERFEFDDSASITGDLIISAGVEVNSERFTDLTGAGLTLLSSALTLDTTAAILTTYVGNHAGGYFTESGDTLMYVNNSDTAFKVLRGDSLHEWTSAGTHIIGNGAGPLTADSAIFTIALKGENNADSVFVTKAYVDTLHLQDLAGAVTDGQVPNTITVDEASDVDTTGTKIAAALATRVSTGAQHWFTFNIVDPNAYYDVDAEFCFMDSVPGAITINEIKVTLDADPTTETEFSLKFADAFIGLANATVIDDTATVAGVTNVTGDFGDATVPDGKCLYLLFDADPDAAIKQMMIKVGYTID